MKYRGVNAVVAVGFRSSVRAVGLLGLVGYVGGCANIGERPPVSQDRVTHIEHIEVPVEGALAEVHQADGDFSLTVSHVCDVSAVRVVERKTTTEAFNKSPARDWLLVGAGVASVGAGAFLVADASNTYPSDKTSRTYNETGPNKERTYGALLIGTGAVLGTIAVVNAIRAGGATVEKHKVTLDAEPEKRGVLCNSRPYAGAVVRGVFGDREFGLGETDATGRLQIKLDQAIPEDLALSPSRFTLGLSVAGQAAGSADLRPVYLRREATAFEQSRIERCAEPAAVDSCNGVDAFIRSYSDGPHAKEARAVLDGALPKLAELEDDLLWAQAQPAGCAKNSFDENGENTAACAPLRQYLGKFPEGRHAKEGRAALAAAEALALVQAAKNERVAKQQQAKEAVEERRRCVAECKVVCSTWRTRDVAACFSGCVESQC